jgi:predicted transcriptional regulator
MKKLIVSIKSSNQVFSDLRGALKKARKGQLKGQHFEIAFDNRKNFERFISNLHVLQLIRTLKPSSVYDLSKKSGMDVSNLNKIITFFELIGVIEVIKSKSNGRNMRAPKVNYDKIEFDLAA